MNLSQLAVYLALELGSEEFVTKALERYDTIDIDEENLTKFMDEFARFNRSESESIERRYCSSQERVELHQWQIQENKRIQS